MINWPVLAIRASVGLFVVCMIALILFVTLLPFHSMRGGDIVLYTTPAACLIAGIGAMCVAIAIRLLRGFELPLDELPDLNEAARRPNARSSGSPAVPGSADAIEQARRQVKGPAIGLLVTGIVNWLTLTASAIVMSGTVQGYVDGRMAEGAQGPPLTIVLMVVGFAFACGILMILAALKMQRLQAYWLAVAASILAVIISPSNLIGLPIGIWALVVLSQPEVRAAFGKQRKYAVGEGAAGSASVLPRSMEERMPGWMLGYGVGD